MSERIEDLQYQGLKIIQNKDYYTFTSDSVILANFLRAKKSDVCVEIGAGCGVISILFMAKQEPKKIFAFEIQPQLQDLCEKNLKLCGLEKIELVKDDVENFEKYITKASVDIVFSNPPYFKPTNFAQNEVKKVAKEEIKLPLDRLCLLASKMLKEGGAFYCVYPSERACELICECDKNRLKVKELFFTENGAKKVKLVVIKAVKGGKDGVKVFPNLVTNDQNGDYLEILHTKNF